VVLVATLRALKFHGGVPAADAGLKNHDALARGMANLEKHIESVRGFGLEPVVAINVRAGDPEDELVYVVDRLKSDGVDAGPADVFGRGGEGALSVAEKVIARARAATPRPKYTYDLTDPPQEKIRRVARAIYGADDVDFTATAKQQLARAVSLGFGELPVCVAKTPLSLSDDDQRVGRPRDFVLTVREVRIAAGAGFLVPLTGEILTMPGLPKSPASRSIDLLADGTIKGVG
jgi:formate--tetrahydrofolate ligase